LKEVNKLSNTFTALSGHFYGANYDKVQHVVTKRMTDDTYVLKLVKTLPEA